MRIDSSGKVGIGVNPSQKLEINGAAKWFGATSTNFAQTGGQIDYYDTGGQFRFNAYKADSTGAEIVFNTGGTTSFAQRMVIDSSGRVGIGTDSPFSSAKLQVRTDTDRNVAIQTGTTHTTGIKINAFNDAANTNIPLELNGSLLSLKTGETERMRIDSSGISEFKNDGSTTSKQNSVIRLSGGGAANGYTLINDLYTSTESQLNIGIGYSGSPVVISQNCKVSATVGNQYLSSNAQANTRPQAFLLDAGDFIFKNTQTSATRAIDSVVSLDERMRITSTGNIEVTGGSFYNTAGITYIGKNSEFEFVDAQASVTKRFRPGVDNSFDLGDSSRRWDDVWATNPTIQTSDRNEKNTIKDTDLGLDFINKLKPVSYKWNNKTRTHYGLIAQDVEDLLDEINKDSENFAGLIKSDVSEEKDNSKHLYGLRYNEFISPMIKAIQELKAEVDKLKQECKCKN